MTLLPGVNTWSVSHSNEARSFVLGMPPQIGAGKGNFSTTGIISDGRLAARAQPTIDSSWGNRIPVLPGVPENLECL